MEVPGFDTVGKKFGLVWFLAVGCCNGHRPDWWKGGIRKKV